MKFPKFLFITIFCFFVFNLNCRIQKEKNKSENNLIETSINSTNSSVWRKVQEQSQDTVVQLFVETLEFNWLEPYKSPDQKTFYGSGFFISDDGYIVSNYHVVEEAVSVKIQIPTLGKERFKTKVVGVCPNRDLSLLKLTDKAFKNIKDKLGKVPNLKLGDSDKILRTQEVLALGYPLGQEKLKSTQGIVSGRERAWGESYIQITAALNKGNSGGPSLNNKGEVIGINTVGVSKAQNVGYIIPINDIKSVITDLHKNKFLRSPMLGSEFNYGNEEMLNYFKNPKPGGLYLSRIYKDSLLDKNGIKNGDMLYQLNDKNIDFYGETVVSWSEDKVSIFDLLNRYPIGKKMNLVIYRDGEKKDFEFNFDLVNPLPIRRIYTPFEKVDYEVIGGMVVMELKFNNLDLLLEADPYLVKYQKRENQYEPRLIITHIFPDSQVQKSRVMYVGDLLKEINGKTVKSLDDFRSAIVEGKKSGFLTVKIEDDRFSVFSLNKILEDEPMLSKRYLYKVSKLISDLGGTKEKYKYSGESEDKIDDVTIPDEGDIENKEDVDKRFKIVVA